MSINDANNLPLDDDRPGPSKKLIASAVVVGVIVLLGVVLSLGNLFGDTTGPSPTAAPSASTTTSTETSSPSSTTTATAASICGLTDVQMTGTVTTAPAAAWTLVGTVAAPSVKGQGPGNIGDDGFRNCFARTPTGSVLAAGNFMAMGGNAALLGHKMTDKSTVPGQGRDAALARPVSTQDSSGVRIQIAGFRVLRYDGSSADVDVAIRTSNGAYAAQVFNLKWSGGDWKVQLAPSGDMPTPMIQIPNLSGYVPWSGA